jgi:O-antigen/teichoic acid export membrane protein
MTVVDTTPKQTMNESSPSPPELGGLRARASHGALISLLGQGGAQILRLLGNLALARMLFPEAFGLMAVVYLIVFALDQFSNVGIPAAVLRFERGDQSEFLDTAWTIQLIRGFGLWLVGIALTPIVAEFYSQPQLLEIMPVATFSAVLLGFRSTQFLVLTRRLQLGRRVAIEMSGRIASVVTMIGMAWVDPTVWVLVIGGLINQAVITVLSHTSIPGPRARLGWDKQTVRELSSFGKWVFASSGLSFVLAQIDVAILGRLIPASLLGVYSMGIIIPMLLRDISFTVMSSVVAPVIAESHRAGPETLRARYATLRRVSLPAVLLMSLGALIVAPTFFEYLYDERYWDARWISQLALIRFWFAFLQTSACLSLLSMGDGRTWAISNVVGLISVTTGCLVGFEMGELRGLLIGIGIGSMTSFVVPAIELARRGVASPAAEIKYTLLGAGLATLVVFATNQSADWIPLGESLRFLIAGGLALTPFGLWTTLRVFRELKQR